MKKSIITTFLAGTPSSTYSVATGYSVGSEWVNTNNGNRFYHKTDGNWVPLNVDSPFYIQGGTSSAFDTTSDIYRTGSLNIGTGTASNSRFVVSSSAGTNSLVVNEQGDVIFSNILKVSSSNRVEISATANTTGANLLTLNDGSGTSLRNFYIDRLATSGGGISFRTDNVGAFYNIDDSIITQSKGRFCLGNETYLLNGSNSNQFVSKQFTTGSEYRFISNTGTTLSGLTVPIYTIDTDWITPTNKKFTVYVPFGIGTGTASNSRFVVSSSGGTTSLVVNESGTTNLIYDSPYSYNTTANALVIKNPNGSAASMGVTTDGNLRLFAQSLALVNGSDELWFNRFSKASIQAYSGPLVFYRDNGFETMRIMNGTGNVGIGTASPSTKLHIYGTQSGAFRLEDGTQGSGKVLVSDATGVASWTTSMVEPSQITITATSSITTDTTASNGYGQKGKNVIIDNGSNAINITVNGGTDFVASYVKHGTASITFVQGSGRTLIQVDTTAVLNGAVGSTATISSILTTDYLRISNA